MIKPEIPGFVKCENCMYFNPHAPGAELGRCQVNPPENLLRTGNTGVWPFTNRTEWCGNGKFWGRGEHWKEDGETWIDFGFAVELGT